VSAVEQVSGASSVDLFRDPSSVAHSGAVPERWLSDYEKLESAERLARSEADHALLADLKALNFEGTHSSGRGCVDLEVYCS
jgi:hypothetical protein